MTAYFCMLYLLNFPISNQMEVEIAGEVERFPHLPLKEKEVPPLPKNYELLKQQEKPLGPSTRKLSWVWRLCAAFEGTATMK